MPMVPVIKLLRPTDWVKNLLVFAAVVFARKLGDVSADLAALGAFGCFCAMASGFYAINDVIDAPRDREHPVKRNRPVASGAIAPAVATVLGVVLVLIGLGGSYLISIPLGWCSASYVVLQALYNLKLKRVLTVDVVAVASGFVIRAAAGAAAINVPISIWLVLSVFFLCLFLALIKRLADVASVGASGSTPWRPHADYDNRPELYWMLGVSGSLALMTYLTYTLSPHAERLFGARAMGLALLTPLALMAMHRMFRRAALGRSDRPTDAVRQDPTVMLSVVLFVAGAIVTLYAPGVEAALANLLQR